MAEFTGVIRHIGDLREGISKNGYPYQRKEVVLVSEEQYPKTCVITLKDDIATSFSGTVGQRAHAQFDFEGYQSEKDGKTVFFNCLKCWRIDL